MIEKNIVFVTGAGSSSCFGFPNGGALVNQLILQDNSSSHRLPNGLVVQENFFREFKEKLKKSNVPSIDIFLANNVVYADLAKILIVKIISIKEEYSISQFSSDNWLKYLWYKMVEGCRSFEEFKKNRIKFITFNYDRTLEIFFEASAINFFDCSNLANKEYTFRIKQIFKIIPILHVFGKIGNMHWENEQKYRTYDSGIGTYDSWNEIGKELKTIYEVERSEVHETILQIINDADEIHFLGFGYNSFNLQLLDIMNWKDNIYLSGTRFKLSNTELKDINSLFSNKLGNLSSFEDNDCLKYLKNEVLFFASKNYFLH